MEENIIFSQKHHQLLSFYPCMHCWLESKIICSNYLFVKTICSVSAWKHGQRTFTPNFICQNSLHKWSSTERREFIPTFVFFLSILGFVLAWKYSREILFQKNMKSSVQNRNQILSQEVSFLTFQVPQITQACTKQEYNPNWICNQHLQFLLLKSSWNTNCTLRTSRSYPQSTSHWISPSGILWLISECLPRKVAQRTQAKTMCSWSSEQNVGSDHSYLKGGWTYLNTKGIRGWPLF